MGDVSPDIITKTQKSLGKYVKKPVLTEKLLKKPPFRFLHDIVKVLVKEKGFLKGLFTEEELNSELVKEKEAKVAFLTKLIDVVKSVSKSDLKARPSKIVAGLEPTETNILLQTFAKIIDKNIDTTDYVKKYKSGNLKNDNTKNANNTKNAEQSKKTVQKSSIEREDKQKQNSNIKKEEKSNKKEHKTKTREGSVNRVKKSSSIETPKSSERKESSRTEVKDARENAKNKGKNSIQEGKIYEADKNEIVHKINENSTKKITEFTSNDDIKSNKVNSDDLGSNNGEIKSPKNEQVTLLPQNENDETQNQENIPQIVRKTSAGLIRPKSARPKSGERDRMMSRMEKSEIKNVPDGGKVVETTRITAPPARPKSSLRPPSVRPSSARPGAPRLRPDSALPVNEPTVMGHINVIVENFDPSGGDEEETVIIQNTSELVEEEGPSVKDLMDMSSENKGQLVEQILEQIQEGAEDTAMKKVDIDWEQDGLKGKDATTKEVTQLRNMIQNLTKTANPLGKLMNYLHEDLDAMHSELQMWTNTKRQLYVEIDKQKKINLETAKPLLAKLERLKVEVKKVEEEISISRSNILRNQQRITELVTKK